MTETTTEIFKDLLRVVLDTKASSMRIEEHFPQFNAVLKATPAANQAEAVSKFHASELGRLADLLMVMVSGALQEIDVAMLGAEIDLANAKKAVEQPPQPREVHRLNDPNVRQDVWRLTGGKCAYCDVPVHDGGVEPTSMCVEHVVPKSMGGPDHLTNYVPACRSCNNSKSDRHVLTLVRKLQRRQETVIVSTQVMPERDGEETA